MLIYNKSKPSPPPPTLQPKPLLPPPLTMSSNPENTDPPTDSTHHKTPSSDLFSSAQVLAGAAKSAWSHDGAAKSAWSHDGAAFDKAEVAQAGEELLDAGAEYGKLREKGYGSYLDKAEGFLHQYQSSDVQKPPTDLPTPPHEEKSKDAVGESTPEESKSAGGFGDYLNIAQGFFKK